MPKGPQLNNIEKNFSARNSLGIESVAISLQDSICPTITSVTPRAFYWAFLVWIIYDFVKSSNLEKNKKSFYSYLKRQDYYFVLANLLMNVSKTYNPAGINTAQKEIDRYPNGPYRPISNYYQSNYGGMMYYYSGCKSMKFIVDIDPETQKKYEIPHLTEQGKELALAFESTIKDTRYYKEYRTKMGEAVPRNVLEEYGKVIRIDLKGFDECKNILKKYLFFDDRNEYLSSCSALLYESGEYLKYIIDTCDLRIEDLDTKLCHRLFYDHQISDSRNFSVPDRLKEVSNEWEIVIGRMYFTTGINMIWGYLLEQLSSPYTLNEWIAASLNDSKFDWDIDDSLSKHLDECVFDFDVRDEMIRDAAIKASAYTIENAVKIILSIYNRFAKNSIYDEEEALFDFGYNENSISLNEAFECVDNHMNKTIREFIIYIIKNWIVEQHYYTALNKLSWKIDGFFYEIVDERFIRKNLYELKYYGQGIKMIQLANIMRDIGVLG